MAAEPIFIDDSDWNADWLRTLSWDLWTTDDDGQYRLVTTIPQLLEVLGVADAAPEVQAEAVRHFMTMPAAVPMPKELRAAVEKNPVYKPVANPNANPTPINQ